MRHDGTLYLCIPAKQSWRGFGVAGTYPASRESEARAVAVNFARQWGECFLMRNGEKIARFFR